MLPKFAADRNLSFVFFCPPPPKFISHLKFPHFAVGNFLFFAVRNVLSFATPCAVTVRIFLALRDTYGTGTGRGFACARLNQSDDCALRDLWLSGATFTVKKHLFHIDSHWKFTVFNHTSANTDFMDTCRLPFLSREAIVRYATYGSVLPHINIKILKTHLFHIYSYQKYTV